MCRRTEFYDGYVRVMGWGGGEKGLERIVRLKMSRSRNQRRKDRKYRIEMWKKSKASSKLNESKPKIPAHFPLLLLLFLFEL